MSLTEEIRAHARALGFALVGVAPAGPVPGAARYAEWLARGYAGRMAYLERNQEQRRDPRRLLPAARSILCLGMGYRQAVSPSAAGAVGQVSCYALGDDYHELIQARLRQLLELIERSAGRPVQARPYVDAGPVLERALAAAAGLGWPGKNTCLIDQRHGSYFFLAELLLDLELEPDAPVPDRCGRCTRCLDACPTHAFAAPRVLDARRCISYLTIELKGPIPPELRPAMGSWVFGCDVCQRVCPWNRRAAPAGEPGFTPRPGLASPGLPELLRLGETEFRHRFGTSPIRRAKRRGLLRNAAVALGNAGDRAAVPVLGEALDDPEPLVRGHAAWALGRLGGAAARAALEAARRREADAYVREEIESALAAL